VVISGAGSYDCRSMDEGSEPVLHVLGRDDDDPALGRLLADEMDGWMPRRLPVRFRARSRPAWHRMARPALVTAAVVVAAVLALTLVPVSRGLPGVRELLGNRTSATPAPAATPRPSTGTGVISVTPTTVGPSSQPGRSGTTPSAPPATVQSGPPVPGATAPAGSAPTPVPAPGATATPTPTPTPTPAPTPTPICILIICL
jgi:hypothetical protein